MTQRRHCLSALYAAATLVFATLAAAPAAAQECNRDCLRSAVTTYVDALLAHDPARLSLAAGARFTENSRDAQLGEGLWQSITGKGSFRQDYLDTAAQIAASHFELREGDDRLLYSVVLRMSGQQITGIEALVQRVAPDARFQPTELERPLRGMDAPLAAHERATRAELIATALTYTNGLRVGNFTDAGTPFADNAYRVENGVITAGPGCFIDDCGLYSQRIMVHPGIIPSVAAVDEEAGIVLLWMNFGFTDSYGPGNALVTFEAFKIRAGKIDVINAFFVPLAIGSPRIWPSLDPVTAHQ